MSILLRVVSWLRADRSALERLCNDRSGARPIDIVVRSDSRRAQRRRLPAPGRDTGEMMGKRRRGTNRSAQHGIPRLLPV